MSAAPTLSPSEKPFDGPGRGRVSPWIKALVVFHIICITVWALPKPKSDVLEGKAKPFGSDYVLLFNERQLKTAAPIQMYLMATGMWQYWDMFAPDPAQTDVWCDADVEMTDGTVVPTVYPRIYDLALPQKYMEERFRKFYERANQEDFAFVWPLLAKVMAKQAAKKSGKTPRMVTLRRHYLQIMPPGEKTAEKYTEYVFFRYVMLPEDLK